MGNELKLSLENFQSISKGELIFHSGTNVIIGQSNSGKSATFRALKACLLNPVGSQRFIKKGTKRASVLLEYNGNQIIWLRTAKESSYKINGEDYIKTGKSNAFKLLEGTGFVTDCNDTIMNIEEELQLPFPFGMSKTDLFKLYEDVFCISDSSIILKAAKEVEDDTKVQIVSLENEIIKNKNKLKELLEFKNSFNLEELKEKRNILSNYCNRIVFLKDGLPLIKKAILIKDFEVNEISFENKLTAYNEKNNLKKNIITLKKLHNVDKSLKLIEKPKAVDLNYYSEKLDILKTSKILKEINTIKAEEILFENRLEKYKELKNFKNFLISLKATVKKKKEDLKKVEEFIENIEQALKEYKVCPLCHQPINN